MSEHASVPLALSVLSVLSVFGVGVETVVELEPTVVELEPMVVELALFEVALVELEAVNQPFGEVLQAVTQTSAERAPKRKHDDPLKTLIDGSVTHFG